MFQLHEVTKTYDGAAALDMLSLEITGGTTTAVLGPSGCGKSTLFKLLLGLITPDSGTITFAGEPVTPATAPHLRRQMGYVIQDGGLFPHLTARQNVSLMARYLKWTSARIDHRLNELTELTRFPVDGLDRYPVQLSGGQRQRVGLMRGLMLDPDVLLLDEPLGALDPLVRYDLQNDLKEIFQALAKTVILVTHDISEAAFFGDRIVLLRAGRIVQQGRLEDFLERPAAPFVTEFIRAGRPPPLGATEAAV